MIPSFFAPGPQTDTPPAHPASLEDPLRPFDSAQDRPRSGQASTELRTGFTSNFSSLLLFLSSAPLPQEGGEGGARSAVSGQEETAFSFSPLLPTSAVGETEGPLTGSASIASVALVARSATDARDTKDAMDAKAEGNGLSNASALPASPGLDGSGPSRPSRLPGLEHPGATGLLTEQAGKVLLSTQESVNKGNSPEPLRYATSPFPDLPTQGQSETLTGGAELAPSAFISGKSTLLPYAEENGLSKGPSSLPPFPGLPQLSFSSVNERSEWSPQSGQLSEALVSEAKPSGSGQGLQLSFSSVNERGEWSLQSRQLSEALVFSRRLTADGEQEDGRRPTADGGQRSAVSGHLSPVSAQRSAVMGEGRGLLSTLALLHSRANGVRESSVEGPETRDLSLPSTLDPRPSTSLLRPAAQSLPPGLQPSYLEIRGWNLTPRSQSAEPVPSVRVRRLAEQGGKEQESGPAHTTGDEDNSFLTVSQARLPRVNSRTEGQAVDASPSVSSKDSHPAEELASLGAGEQRSGGVEGQKSAGAVEQRGGDGMNSPLRPSTLALGPQPSVLGPQSSTPNSQPPAPSPQPPSGAWHPVIEQVAGKISAHVRQNSHEVLIRLEPPELGGLKIDLVLEGDRVQARIVAEVAEVKALIQSHLPELRQALQHHGLELGHVRVDVGGWGGERGDLPQGFQQESGAREGGSQRSAVSGQRSAEREIVHSDQSSSVSVWV